MLNELVTSQRTTPFLGMTVLILTASFIFFAVHWITFCSPYIFFSGLPEFLSRMSTVKLKKRCSTEWFGTFFFGAFEPKRKTVVQSICTQKYNLSGWPNLFLGSRTTMKNMLFTLPIARSLGLNDIFVLIVCFQFTEGTYSFKVKVNVHSSFFHEVVVFTNLFICCFYIQSTSQKRQ